DRDDEEGEEGADRAEDRHDPGEEVAAGAARDEDCDRRVAGQDEEPEEERSLLPAPERRQTVARGQRPARVRGDVGEGEVVAQEGRREHGHGDGGRAESGEERVPRGEREPAATPSGRVAARERRIEEAAEGDE